MKYGLEHSVLSQIVSVLSGNSKISEIVLFGSRAKGNYSAGSDIDIALKGKGLNLDDLLQFKSTLDEITFPNKLDLVIYGNINEPALTEHIDRVGISLSKELIQ